MKKVVIPFPAIWKDKLLGGQKTCTSRTKRYGSEGDTFDAFGATFQLVKVSQVHLWHIAGAFYGEEGCESPSAFVEVWKRLHPKIALGSSQLVWGHHFRRLKEVEG